MAASHIDFRTLPSNVPSLCIPRVYSNIDEARIRRVFAELDMGDIDRIDVVGKSNEKGDKFNRVFVHFKRWNMSENANIARERLINGKEVKILYDDPWFWKVSAYREPVRHARPQGSGKKASLQVDCDEEASSPQPTRRAPNTKPRPPAQVQIKQEPTPGTEVKQEPRPPVEERRQAAYQSRWTNRDPPSPDGKNDATSSMW